MTTAKGATDAAPERTSAPATPAGAANAASTSAAGEATVNKTAGKPGAADAAATDQPDLRARALADDGVQAMLEIFPAEIREVEEIK